MEMWMWISVGVVWLLFGLVNWRIMYNITQNTNDDWSVNWVYVIFGFFFPVANIPAMLICEGKDCFSSKSIYYNAKEQQIMTKGGKCLYDKRTALNVCELMHGQQGLVLAGIEQNKRIEKLEREDVAYNLKIDNNNNEIDKKNDEMGEWERVVEAQLQCQAKGHGKWVFVKKDLLLQRNCPELTGYIFKCEDCDLEVAKTKNELTPKQREHLKSLGL